MPSVQSLKPYLEEILALRTQKVSLRKIAEKYGTNHVTMSNFLKEHGQSTDRFLHNFNKRFFEKIDTEEKAYYLGVGLSDGSIKEDGFAINMTDRDVIDKFKEIVGYDGELYIVPPKKEHHKTKYEINLYSVEMQRDLAKYGIIPNKSLTLKFPNKDLIPNNLIRHVIRGIFDGDGGFSYDQYQNQWNLVFTGTKELLEGIELYSPVTGNFNYHSQTGANTWQWRIRIYSDIVKFCNWIYENCKVRMDRKYNQMLKCVQDLTCRKSYQFENKTSINIISEIQDWINTEGFNFVIENDTLIDKDKNYVISIITFENLPYQNFCKDLLNDSINKGYGIIIIYEDEWINRNKQIKNFILSKLGKFKRKIFARQCDLIQIDKNEALNFINYNHIQPSIRGKTYLGLKYENELVGIVQLKMHHRNSKDITLSRMCFVQGVQIIGGFSRLIHSAVKWCQENNYNQLITWSDNRLTSGKSYTDSGFILKNKLDIDYYYIKDGKRMSKQNMRKDRIGCPKELTERQYTTQLGYKRLYDAGKKSFIYTIK